MTCTAKHTKYQPTDEEWLCPKCGANSDHFIIEDPAEDADEDCEELHVYDNVVCSSCGFGGSGRTVASRMSKKKNLVPCPCCKGSGFISHTEQSEGK